MRKNEIEFSINNEVLHGWKIDLNKASNKTILYFGGNAEDVVYLNHEAKEFNVRQSITFNYPGYGKSSGKPSQLSLYNNALVVYDLVVKKYQLSADDIIVIGRSLGSSVATYLAANREVSGLILITPFDSIENMASKQYKFFPVKFLLKHPFSTVDYISSVKNPVLMIAAYEDEIIADINLQNLREVAGKQNRFIQYPYVGHNTIQMHESYYKEINNFIEGL
ncbi:MAG: alpha/beta hydrolase [Gammaproteobacteria bacterium]|nr:alpha/beta hydrolase [Gammaproteobacteria bacterium]